MCLFTFLSFNQGLALDKKASSELSHYIMGAMYDRLGKINLAIEEYKKALKVNYNNPQAHLNLATSYIKNNEIDKAITELGIVINFEPDTVEPHAILGLLYSLQNKPEAANHEYEIALQNASKLEPKNTEIYKSLGAVYLKQNKFQEAENIYRLILNLSCKDDQAHFYLGTIYRQQKKNALAEKELKEAIKNNPDYPEALNYLGYIYAEENRNLDQAEILIKKALEIEPDNGAYIDSLGWLYFKKGKTQEALHELIRASKLIEDPVVYDHLGDVYFNLRNNIESKLNWQKSLELDPAQNKVKQKIEKLNNIKNALR